MTQRTRNLAAFMVAAVVAAATNACSPTRTFEALGLLRALAGSGDPRASTEPAPRAITYAVAGDRRHADLYDLGAARAALVLVPGAAPAGKDHPRLVAFAKTLARARFAVLVPDIANLRALNVRPADANEIAQAARHLMDRSGRSKVGVVAISYAAGPAILAALENSTGAQVSFILAIGGYYDLEAVITFFTTGHYRGPGAEAWRHRSPNAHGKWIFVKNNAVRIKDPSDSALLAEMAERKLVDLDTDVNDLVARLGPEGQRVNALLTNDDPNAVPRLIAALPTAVRSDIARLDLSHRDLRPLKARLILVHGRNDPIIPHTESEALAAALPSGQVDLYLVDHLAHVELGPIGLLDSLTLVRAVYRVLGERDSEN